MFAFLGLPITNSSSMSFSIWVLDSGASHHMSPDSLSFSFLSSTFVLTIDDTLLPLANIGFVITPHLSLPYVYHILNLTLNLVSIGQL